MKKIFNILFLSSALMAIQACESKSEKTNDETTAVATPAEEETVPTVAEKRAKIAKQKAEREEMRKIAFEERIKVSHTYTDKNGVLVYHKAEIDPSFDGGNKAMMNFLRDNLQFPESAKEKGIEGTVFVDFVIGKSGSVREVEVTNDTNEEVDQSFRDEAIRVVSSMPKWLPGRQQGKAVDVKFSVPITFEMI